MKINLILILVFVTILFELNAQTLIAQYDIGSSDDDIYFRNAYGLAGDSTALYLSSYSSSSQYTGYIFKYDFNGNRIDSVSTGLRTSQGLAWDGKYFWYFNRATTSTSAIYKIDSTGTRVDSILTGTNYIGGLCWDGTGLWYSLYYPNADAALYKLDVVSQTIIDTIQTIGTQPQGIAYDNNYFYYSMDDNDGDPENIYIYDPSIEDTVGYIPMVDPISQGPKGLVWDGQYLWLIADPVGTVYRSLFKFELGDSGAPRINIPQELINFPQTTVGDTAIYILNVNNTGTVSLFVDSIVFDNSVFFVDDVQFPLEIAPGGSYNFNLKFAPKGYINSTGNVQIYNNDPIYPVVQLEMAGQGVFNGPFVGIIDTVHNFGNVWIPEEGTAYWNLGIINMGDEVLQVPHILFNSPAYYIDDSLLPLFISSNDTFFVPIFFTPTNDTTYIDTASVLTNDTLNQYKLVYLQGAGLSGPFALGQEFWTYQVPDNPATGFNEYRPLGLKSIRDVTGDGHDDVLIATRNYWTICLDGFSAGTGREIWRFSSYISSYSAGGIGNTNDLPPQQKAIAIAEDLNSDGFQDVVIGTGGGNERVYALNGVTGDILWQFGTDHPDSFGLGDMTSVYVNEDFNGDDVNDVIATGSGFNDGLEGRRTVYCFDGTNGQILWQKFLGCYIRMAQTIGDVNGNTSIDVVAGTGDGISNTYSIYAFDSQTLATIWSFPISSNDGGGKEVLRYEINGETADVIAGSYFGEVYRIDGETGSQEWMFGLGVSGIYHLSIINDVDNDGYDDILVSSFNNSFYCIGGADGLVIWSAPFGNSTWSAVAIPDITGDGIDDVAAASKTDNIYVLDGTDGTILHTHPMNSGMLQGATLANVLPDMDNNHSWEILGASDDGHLVAFSGGTNVTSVKENQKLPIVPEKYTLSQNYPNPFNPTTEIKFGLPRSAIINLTVYNLLGEEIAQIIENKYYRAGEYKVEFNAGYLSSGVYFYKLQSKLGVHLRKMIVIK